VPLIKNNSAIGFFVMVMGVIFIVIITTKYSNDKQLVLNSDYSITEHRHVTLRNWLIDKIYNVINKNEWGISYNKSSESIVIFPDRVIKIFKEIGRENNGVTHGLCNKDRSVHLFLIECGNNKMFTVYFDENWENSKCWQVL
jgi:hypothetical protein